MLALTVEQIEKKYKPDVDRYNLLITALSILQKDNEFDDVNFRVFAQDKMTELTEKRNNIWKNWRNDHREAGGT